MSPPVIVILNYFYASERFDVLIFDAVFLLGFADTFDSFKELAVFETVKQNYPRKRVGAAPSNDRAVVLCVFDKQRNCVSELIGIICRHIADNSRSFPLARVVLTTDIRHRKPEIIRVKVFELLAGNHLNRFEQRRDLLFVELRSPLVKALGRKIAVKDCLSSKLTRFKLFIPFRVSISNTSIITSQYATRKPRSFFSGSTDLTRIFVIRIYEPRSIAASTSSICPCVP